MKLVAPLLAVFALAACSTKSDPCMEFVNRSRDQLAQRAHKQLSEQDVATLIDRCHQNEGQADGDARKVMQCVNAAADEATIAACWKQVPAGN